MYTRETSTEDSIIEAKTDYLHFLSNSTISILTYFCRWQTFTVFKAYRAFVKQYKKIIYETQTKYCERKRELSIFSF